MKYTKSLCLFLFFAWVFVSHANENADEMFLSRARKILKLSSTLMDNQGVSIGLSASGIVGAGATLEAVNLRGNVAFFCSLSASVKAENRWGYSKDFSYIQTRGCDVPARYEGLFITLTGYGGVNFLAGGSLNGGISYGFNYPLLVDTIRLLVLRRPENLIPLLEEMGHLGLCLLTDPASKVIESLVDVIIHVIGDNKSKIVDLQLRNRVTESLSKLKNLISKSRSALGCKFDNIPQKLKENSSKFFELTKDSLRDHTLASLLPSKDQLALIVESVLDRDTYPNLKTLLLEILRRDMSGCDALSVGASYGGGGIIGTGVGPAFGIGISLSHYAKIGPTYNIKEIRENSIDRYVQEEGLVNLKADAKNTYTRVCNAAGYCVWKASCMLSSKEAFKRGLKRIKEKACESGAYLTTQFLNGLSSCVKGNFKELVLSPYDILTKVGDE